MKGLKDKVILVTGATSGIGQAIAIRFAEEQSKVGINYRKDISKGEATDALLQQASQSTIGLPADTVLLQGDVTQTEQVERMFQQVIERFGRLDVLVNNAGIQIAAESDKLSVDDFDRVLAVNLKGSFLCAQQAIQQFLKQDSGGSIINISSVHEIIPKPQYLGYSVSKGGMENLTRTLALEFSDKNIRVNAVGPGATITPINDAWKDDPEARAEVESHIPMARSGTSSEMAAAVAFLASDEATYITGQTLFVDGGLTLYPDFRSPWSSGGVKK